VYASFYDTSKQLFAKLSLHLFENAHTMERIVNLHIEKLPEGYYLATSDNVQGLIAQGRTISETIEIAKDVAKKLIEAQEEQVPFLIS